MDMVVSLRSYRGSTPMMEEKIGVPLTAAERVYEGHGFQVLVTCQENGPEISGEAVFSFTAPTAPSSAALSLTIGRWSKDNYVFAPGAVYNGNRFPVQKLPYPPYAQIAPEDALTAGPVVTDILKLSHEELLSRIELRAGDLSVPCLGYYDKSAKTGFLLYTKQQCSRQETGLWVRENLCIGSAEFGLSSPAVREEFRYFFGERRDGSGFYPDAHTPSEDMGRCFRQGDSVTLPFRIFRFQAENLCEFFAYFNETRGCLEHGELKSPIPFYPAYQAVKNKYQRENFIQEENSGYYAVGVRRELPQQCWQAGWIGGGMNSYAFLLEDTNTAKDRSLATLRFIFSKLQHKNGWICGMYGNGVYYGDTFDLSKPNATLLIRKNADLLYFGLKQLMAEPDVLGDCTDGLRSLADAFVRLYRKYGQLGQFIDVEKDLILIGNSTSAAIACAALALAYEIFGENSYLETAEALGELFNRDYLQMGVINGAPGEICQAPDSESAFGLLESYVQLYETTENGHWLTCAKQTFEQAITWVMSYDYEFPPESTASKLGVQTTGTVFANAQNKHSAPGICTLSGASLLKLYRFTGEEVYLRWLHKIAGSLMQFVSLPERPVFTLDKKYLPAGYVNERVQTSDWEGKETIGEFLYGSNWPEVSILLTYAEVPSVYLDFDLGTATALDCVECNLLSLSDGEALVELTNPLPYPTEITVLCGRAQKHPELGHNYYRQMQKIKMNPGQQLQQIFTFAPH